MDAVRPAARRGYSQGLTAAGFQPLASPLWSGCRSATRPRHRRSGTLYPGMYAVSTTSASCAGKMQHKRLDEANDAAQNGSQPFNVAQLCGSDLDDKAFQFIKVEIEHLLFDDLRNRQAVLDFLHHLGFHFIHQIGRFATCEITDVAFYGGRESGAAQIGTVTPKAVLQYGPLRHRRLLLCNRFGSDG